MEIPLELRRLPPTTTLAWIAGRFGDGSRVTSVRRMHNASAAAVHAVDVEDAAGDRHALVVRRWVRTDTTPAAGAVAVENEAATLTLLASALASTSSPRAPTLVAADPSGEGADVPALVMTRLPGRDVSRPPTSTPISTDWSRPCARFIRCPSQETRSAGTRRGGSMAAPSPPRGRAGPRCGAGHSPSPAGPSRRVSRCCATATSIPATSCGDSGRCRGWSIGRAPASVRPPPTSRTAAANLALLFGPDVADEFARRYGPVDDLAWFDVVDVAGWRTLDPWRWHDAGRSDITDEAIIHAFDDFLAAAVERCVLSARSTAQRSGSARELDEGARRRRERVGAVQEADRAGQRGNQPRDDGALRAERLRHRPR